MASKQEKRLIDLAKKLRNFRYKVKNFFYYRLLVSSKHVLIVGGGQKSIFKQKLQQNFSNTWRIATIDYDEENSENASLQNALSTSSLNPQQNLLNIQLNINEPFISQNTIEDIENKILKFSKQYECVLCLGSDLQEKPAVNIRDKQIFEQYEIQSKKNVQLALLTGYLASKCLTPNGIVLVRGCQKSFEGPNYQEMASSIAMNQVHYLNLTLGDREDLDIDSYALNLLQRENGIWEDEKECKNMLNLIRLWAEGKKRPVSGSYVKFHSNNKKLVPEYL